MGRQTIVTEDVVKIFEEAFKDGANVSQACILANVSRETFYNRMEADDGFRDRITAAQQWLNVLAKKNLADALKRGDRITAAWWLERKEKAEFAPRQELTGAEGTPLGYVYSGDVQQLNDKPDAVQISKAEEVSLLPEASTGEAMGEEVRIENPPQA